MYRYKIEKYQTKKIDLIESIIGGTLDFDYNDNQTIVTGAIENNMLSKMHFERDIYEDLATLFIDKIMPTAISHSNSFLQKKYRNLKIVIVGGKALNFYVHIHEQNRYIKSFDYDLSIVNGDRLSSNTIGKYITAAANSIYTKNRQLMTVIYDNIIFEINKKSNVIHYLDSIELEANGIVISELFVHNNKGMSLFNRKQNSCYIIICYKFKSFTPFVSDIQLQEANSIDINTIDNPEYQIFKSTEYPNTITKDKIYYTGFGVTDIHHDKDFPYFVSVESSEFYLEDKIITAKIRKYQDGYVDTYDYKKLYLPFFDTVVINLLTMAFLKNYPKKNRNKKKLKNILEIMELPREKLNIILFDNAISLRNVFMSKTMKQYVAIIRHGISEKKLDMHENELTKCLIKIARLYDSLASISFKSLLKSLPIITSDPFSYCDKNNFSFVKNIIDYQINIYDQRPDANIDVVRRYVSNSSDINVPIILGNLNKTLSNFNRKITVAECRDAIINEMYKINKESGAQRNNKSFFVYNTSKIYNKNLRNNNLYDNNESTYFKVGEKYVLPTFMSTTYNKCLSNTRMFIGYETQPFVFRILLPVNYPGYMCIGYEDEIILKPSTTLEIVGINRSYVKISDELTITCLLIDCVIDNQYESNNIDNVLLSEEIFDENIDTYKHSERTNDHQFYNKTRNNIQEGAGENNNELISHLNLLQNKIFPLDNLFYQKNINHPNKYYSQEIPIVGKNKTQNYVKKSGENFSMLSSIKNQPNIILPLSISDKDTAIILKKYFEMED